MKQGKKNLSSNAKTIYLGGYSYLTEQPSAPFSLTKSYMDLYTGETLSLDTQVKAEIRESYNQYVANKASTKRSFASLQPKGLNTVTKYVCGYRSVGWETYSSVGDSTGLTCGPIAVTNICKYWDLCKGKTRLYTAGSTYQELKKTMAAFGSSSSAFKNNVYKWRDYVSSKGYTPSIHTFDKKAEWDISFATYKEFIDWNRPFLYHALWPTSHAVAAFGYQYIEVENTIIVADAVSSTCVYRTWSSLGHGKGEWDPDGFFGSQSVQQCSCVVPL